MNYKNKDLIYYGPHPCQNCDKDGKKGTMIIQAKSADKVFAYNHTHANNYPNCNWKKHVCPSN